MRLTTKEKMAKVTQDEWESQQAQSRQDTENKMEQMQLKHDRMVQEMHTNLKGRQADLEIATKTEEQLKETVGHRPNVLIPHSSCQQFLLFRPSTKINMFHIPSLASFLKILQISFYFVSFQL